MPTLGAVSYLAWVLAIIQPTVRAFNLDARNVKILRSDSPPGSLFGYAFKFTGGDEFEPQLIVGAPNARNGEGAVFECDSICMEHIVVTNPVKKGLFDYNGITRVFDLQSRNNQHLGAAVDGRDGTVLACAPLLTELYVKRDVCKEPQKLKNCSDDPMVYMPRGQCYVGTNSSFKPLDYYEIGESRTDGHLRFDGYGSMMLGTSAMLHPDSKTVYAGGPGTYMYQGVVAKFYELYSAATMPTDYRGNEYESWNRGFSMAALGKYIAVGLPGHANNTFTGAVEIYDEMFQKRLQFIANEGTHVAGDLSRFGFSLASCDVNGDNLVDLIVGAPFSSILANGEISPDAGAIFAYCQKSAASTKYDPKEVFHFCGHVTGTRAFGRFGYSMACAGDLNSDSSEDLVVGALASAKDTEDAVHVVNGISGKTNGLALSQTIFASNVSESAAGFGFALDVYRTAKPVTVAIGCPLSDEIITLKPIPVLVVIAEVMVEDDQVDPAQRSCDQTYRGAAVKVACTTLRICYRYSADNFNDPVSLMLSVSLDNGHPEHRARVLSGMAIGELTMDVTVAKTRTCESVETYFIPDMRDRLSDIVAACQFSQHEAARFALDVFSSNSANTTIELKKDCRSTKCLPDLQLSLVGTDICTVGECSSAKDIALAENQELHVSVSVLNALDDAYKSTVTTQLPPGLHFVRAEGSQASRVLCQTNGATNVTCDLPDPLAHSRQLRVKFIYLVTSPVPDAVVEFVVSSSNHEEAKTMHDNSIQVPVRADRDASAKLIGQSSGDVRVVETERTKNEDAKSASFASELGPKVVHKYQLRNDGAVRYTKAIIDIFWPVSTINGEPLLYVAKLPASSASDSNAQVDCTIVGEDFINPLHLGFDDRGERKGAHKRPKRALSPVVEEIKNALDSGSQAAAEKLAKTCSSSCGHIRCSIENVPPLGGWVLVEVNSYLVTKTFVDDGLNEATLDSAAVANVQQVGSGGGLYRNTWSYSSATTKVSVTVIPAPSVFRIPWWVWLLCVAAALVILGIMVVVLWRLGFFRRNRSGQMKADLIDGTRDEGDELLDLEGLARHA